MKELSAVRVDIKKRRHVHDRPPTPVLGSGRLSRVEIFLSTEEIEVLRHSSAHILAQAVKELYPKALLAIGPAIPEGFYYDFDFDRPFTPEDLHAIEKRMAEIVKRNLPIVRKELLRIDAIRLFKEKGEDYKLELIAGFPDETFSVYEQGDFVDLCRGPHLRYTGKAKAFKLLSIAGAYWRGDEKNKMLQRVYGTAFLNKDELKAHLDKLDEAKKRDHRKLGKELDLFSINDEAGGGLVLWHPKGARIRKAIEDFWRDEHYKAGYELVFTPHVARLDLWKQSGHWDFYRENMYSPMDVEGVEYELKPMNCPFHIMIYNSSMKSYRDLPIRLAELGTVYRFERSGVLHGLMRVRGFTQDDAHIYCTREQLGSEIDRVIEFVLYILRTFGFSEFEAYLSTMPEKFVGEPAVWDEATEALKEGLERHNLSYKVDEGGGAFYGPKIDLKIKDSIGRSWQCSTIQVDFNLPEKFDVNYIGEDSKRHRPIMIHRALMGSLERFFGVLIEHYAGAFPTWLSPVQALVMTITDKQIAYADGVLDKLRKAGIRAELDKRNEKIGYKIREAQMQKVPYMLVVGEKEMENEGVAVRKRSAEDIGFMDMDGFVAMIKEESMRKG
ncbi:MAG: threonine--tRNA ligase [Deltaproteobacteria bacterium]|nr:threonine--tRNA ligase [Deltaproteobacteria bacterium]